MIRWVVDVHKASDGGIPTDFTRSGAGKEGSLRLVLERVKLARRDGAGKTDLGIYQGYPKIRTPCGLVGVRRGSSETNWRALGRRGHTGIKSGVSERTRYE
jgi:hypothetical protein